MIDVANELKVDAVINAGDTLLKYLDDPETDFSWYAEMIKNFKADVITAVGNHDVWVEEYWKRGDANAVYQTILTPVLKNMEGVCLPEGAEEQGLCYYYKDYQQIRVLVLNAMSGDESVDFWDEKEAEWLRKTLNDALVNNLYVICVSHVPFENEICLRDPSLSWNSYLDYHSGDGLYTNPKAIEIVQSFIDAGGSFICWLSGHSHVDEVLEAEGYEGQLMLCVASARYSFHGDGVYYEDKYDPRFYCFDYIGVDIKRGLLKRMRFGWNMDASLKTRHAFCYDFINHVILTDR